MSRNGKVLSLIAVGGLVIALGLAGFVQLLGRARDHLRARQDPVIAPVAAGAIAADFKLKDLGGSTISLSSLRGKVVFLNVWATWCEPCRREMPSIESLYEEFRQDKNLVVLAVSQDSVGRGAVDSYIRKSGFKFTVLLDPANAVGEAYNVSGIPETFIIARNGRIVAHHSGPYDWSKPEMRDALEELLKSREG
jgi:cytochrome c biogenesis protein CcmG, thiol:disulfide interchange protein DsbE